MKIFFSVFSLFVVILLGANDILACSCRKIPDQIKNDIEKQVSYEFNEAQTVFTGVVTRIEKKGGVFRVKFSVDQMWKGEKAKIIFVSTVPLETLCGFPFKSGKKYLVYARKSEENVLQTNKCSRTGEIKNVEQDLKHLDKLKASNKGIAVFIR